MLPTAPGEWYISVVCEVCKRRVLLFRDLSKGNSKIEKSWISVKCPGCNQNTSSQIEPIWNLPIGRAMNYACRDQQLLRHYAT